MAELADLFLTCLGIGLIGVGAIWTFLGVLGVALNWHKRDHYGDME